MTVPNVLTFSRILLIPLLVWLLFDRRLNAALVVFFLAGMTDGLDGLIARLFDQKSKLGATLDPLADKLLLVSSFILLGRLGLVPLWLVILTVGRDIIIVGGLIALYYHRVAVEIKPSIVSKMTTLVQLMTVLVCLASSLVALPAWGYSFLFGSTALLSLASGAHYVSKGMALYEAHQAENHGR